MRNTRSVGAAAALAIAAVLSGCSPKPGVLDVPPLPHSPPGVYTDINPRWSRDGERIAFLRATPDRRLQLFMTNGNLDRATALLEAELVSPDRLYDAQECRYSSPDSIAWSPDDRFIAFERAEWFQFDDGQRLPGTGIWSFELRTGRVAPIALHPKRYTNLYYYYHSPDWSPDGAYVSFVAEGINGQHLVGLRCVAAQNQRPKEVAPRFDNYASSDWPAWRPTQEAKPATSEGGHPVLAYSQAIFRTPAVPITATLRCRQPGSAAPDQCRELWRMRPSEYAATAAVRGRAFPREVIEPHSGHPVWSPDGSRIAFILTSDANQLARSAIWVLDTASGTARQISPDDGRGYTAPVWIDDGRLGALSARGGRFDVVELGVAERVRRTLGTIDTSDCDWSPDRTRIVYAATPVSRPNAPDDVTTLRILELDR